MKKQNGIIKFLFGFMSELLDLKSRFTAIKQNTEEKKQSKLLGKKSIKYTVIATLSYAFMFALIILGVKIMNTALMVLGIIFIVAGAVGMLFPLGHFLLGLSSFIKQLKLNKQKIGWIALAVWILCVLLLVTLSLIVISKS